MSKRFQNRIAESRHTLPITAFYSICIWLLAGLVTQQWWIQFGCFVVSAWMMMMLNKENMLIRIYSRLVSSAYLVLTCAAVFLFASRSSAITALALLSGQRCRRMDVLYILLFRCRQSCTDSSALLPAHLLAHDGMVHFLAVVAHLLCLADRTDYTLLALSAILRLTG